MGILSFEEFVKKNRAEEKQMQTAETERLPFAQGDREEPETLPYRNRKNTAAKSGQFQEQMNRGGVLTLDQYMAALKAGQSPVATGKQMQKQFQQQDLTSAQKTYTGTKQALSDAQTSKKDARQNYADMLIKRDNMRSQYEEMLEDYNQRLQNGETEEDLADYYAAIQDKLNKANVYDQQVTNAYDELKNAAYSAKFGENAAKEQAAGTAMQNAYDSAPGRVSTLQNGEYAHILQRPDYAAMSQAGESKNNLSGRYDATYDYINDINGQRGITKLNALQGRGGGDLGKYDFMTKDEVGVYNYLYATEGKKSAEQFLKSLDIDLNAQYQGWSSNVVADVADDNAAAGTLFSLGTAVMAPARGITGAAAMAQDMYRTVTGQEIDPNSSLRRLSQNTNAVRESVSDSIRQSAPGKIGGVGSFLYNVGMSAADSTVNMLTAQGVVGALGYAGDAALKAVNILSSATMSSEVASMSVAESKEKGYSDAGAMSLGLIRGGIEYLSEKLGGEWVIKQVKANPTSLFKTLIRSMIPEGIEENMSDVGNETVSVISDLLFGTDESWLRTTYNAYKANGSKNPFLDTAISAVIQEVLSFSGGALASVGNASVQFAGYKSSIKAGADALHASESDVVKIMEKYDIENPRVVKLIAELTDSDSVKSFDEAMSAYENAQEVVDEAMRLSGQRNGSFLREAGIGSVENQVDSAWDVLTGKVTAEESQQKAQTAMKALGLSQSQQRAAEGSNKYVAANATISQKETATVFEAAQKKLEAEGIKDERLAGAITAAALNESAKQQDASGAPEPTKLQQKLIDDSPVAQKLVRELAAESVQRAAETVVSEEDLQNVKYDGGSAEIVSVGKNGVQIRTADGTEKTVPVERLEVSGGYGTLLDAAAGMENGNEMLRAYKPGQNVAKYISAWQSAETLIGAKTNYTMEQARQAYPALYKTLTDSQLIRAIEAGRETKAENEKKAKAESEQYGKLREEAKQKVKEGKDKRTEGKVKLDGVDEKKLNKQQKKVYNMVKAVAKVLNFDFELYDGEKTTGGVYIQGGKIRVNINSGAYTGKYIGAATLAHEITHALQGYDKQGYAEFTDFITNEVLTPDELARLVNIQLNLEPDLTPGEALDEVIANGCAKMLLNNEAIRNLAEQNRSLFGWIKDKIDEITGNINDAYDEIDLSDDLDVYKAARIFERSFDEIRERWNKMLETANENKAAEKITGKKISADGGIKFQKWQNEGGITFEIVDSADKAQQKKLLVDAYTKAKQENRGIIIPKETVDKYFDIYTNPNLDIKETVKKLYEETLLGTTASVSVEEGAVVIKFENDGKKKSVGWRMKPGKAATFEYLKSLVENSVYAYSETNRTVNEASSIPLFHYFGNVAEIAGEEVPIKIQARDILTGRNPGVHYYTHNIDNENASSIGPVSGTSPRIDSNALDASRKKSVPHEAEKNKRQNQKLSDNEFMAEGGDTTLDYDADTDSVNIQFHRLTWEASDYVTERDKAAKEIAAKLGVTQKRAKEYIDAVNSVSKYIAENKGRLDYEDTGLSPFVGNVEYGGSFDFTTLCDKRRLYTGTFSAIQRALPNTALTAIEMLKLRAMMDAAGLKVPCGKCYVEGSRASMGVYTQKFIELYKKYHPGAWAPNMAQMNTPDGIEWVRNNHPEVYEQYEYFWNHYGTLRQGDPNLFASQQKPKLYQMRSAYKGEILKHFKSDSSIEEKNKNGGVRLQSFSDFEMAHLLDAMQVIMDMSRVGLAGQAYTKIPNFAWALGRTGLKINLSIDAWDVVDGKLVFNNKEGMNFDEAMRIRDANSKNVGTICCVYDDAQLLAAMADPRIDFIIPFHRSQWKKSQYKAMGLPATTKDYTYQQNEKWLHPLEHTHEYRGRQVKDRCTNYMPNEYWDFSKSGKENAEEYLRMCARDGKRPKFYKFLTNNGDGSYSLKEDGSTDGYWKLLIDFKMYDNDGKGSPQMPVQPTFNMAEVERMLESYEGGHNTFPTAQGVVDEFVEWYKEQHPGREQYQKLGFNETEEEQQARKESFDNLKAENRILRARAEYWKAQTRKTKERTVRQQDTDRLANELLRKYESKADKAEVKEAIKELGDWLVQTDELDYDELKAKAEAIAEDIISGNYVLLDNSQQEQLDRLKDYLKSTPVNLTKSDFNDTGDENFRKRYGRYFTVSENGRTIDSLWGELAATFGEGVFPEDTYSPGDMLNMIADYLDMWKPQYGNEFEMYHGEAVDAVTNEIIDAVLSEEVRQTPGTYADKAQQKLNAQIAKDKAKLDALREAKNARIEELKRQASEKSAQIRMAEKAAKYEAVSKVKQHYQDMLKRQRNKRSDTAVRAKIKKLHKELTDILLKPKEGRYVPRELVKATAEILGAIDTTSGRAVKAKAAMAELKVKYDALAKDTKYALTYDETVSGMIQELAENIGDGSIYDLTGTELESVYNTLKALKHTIVTANKLVGAKIEADAFEAANQMMRETESAKGVPTKTLRRFVLAQMTPSSAFRMFGGYVKNSMWEQMFNELNNGQLTQTQILMEGGQIFRELIDDKKNLKRLHDQKNLVDIGLKDDQGNAIKVTRGMMLSVYMHLQNEQNAKHVAYGGLTVPRLAQYYKNQMKDAFNGKTGRAVAFATEIADLNRQLSEAETSEEQNEIKERLAELNDQTDAYMSDLRAKIEDQLTDYDRKWIAAAQQFFDVYSKGKLNEVTEMVYGFEKAQVDNYFPLHTDPDYRAASFDTIARDMSLENAGFMKERVNGANPILLEDITDVISSQLRRTAQYCGLMPAIRNFNKVYGKARAGYSMSVQSAMARTFENEGKKYIENLMADLNGARKTEPNIFDELRGNMAGAVLTLNPRVTLAQAASFPSAAAEIGYKPLMKALTDMKNPMWDKGLTEEIAKWTPLWWYRMQGYSTAELGDIKTNEQLMNKVMDKMKWATGWIQAADGLTTGGLWQASKYYVDENFSDLKKGSDEYMMKVAEVYNRVLEKTQPDYTTMQRPDILRNPNAIVKQLTMFMTQRLQNTNILYDAAATYAHYVRDADAGRNDVTAADVKQARTRLVWAVSSQVAASATIVIFKALADAIMHNLKAYRDDDDELTTESVVKTLLTNFAETISGNILWGSEMFSWMKSAFTGERYYGISLNGVDTFADTLSDANQMVQKAVKGDREGSLKAGGKLAKAVAQFFGVPLGNAEKIAQMARNYIEDAQNGTFMEAGVDRTRAQNTHILFNALQTGDTAKAERIRAEFKDQKDEQAALKGYIKELYTSEDQQIQKDEAISLLQKYGGMTKRDAEDAAQQWTMEVVTGTKYSDLQDAYISGDIPRAQAEKYYKTYSSNGRTTQAEAVAKVNEWTCEKETGIAYGDIGTEVKTGRLSTDKAVQMLVKYGGKSQSAAQKTVNGYAIEHQYNIKPSELEDEYLAGHVSDQTALDILKRYKYYGKEDAGTKAAEDLERMKFVRSNPNTEDISITQVRNYNASGLKGYVSAADYTQAAKMMGTFKGTDNDNDGKTDSYSVAIQKLEYIDTFDLTSDQKTALAVALGINEKTVRRKAPWR